MVYYEPNRSNTINKTKKVSNTSIIIAFGSFARDYYIFATYVKQSVAVGLVSYAVGLSGFGAAKKQYIILWSSCWVILLLSSCWAILLLVSCWAILLCSS